MCPRTHRPRERLARNGDEPGSGGKVQHLHQLPQAARLDLPWRRTRSAARSTKGTRWEIGSVLLLLLKVGYLVVAL